MNTHPETAVVDRIEDGQLAVLLVGDGEREVNVPVEQLPPGAVAGVWLGVILDGDRLQWAQIDAPQTAAMEREIEEKLTRLRGRGSRLRPS